MVYECRAGVQQRMKIIPPSFGRNEKRIVYISLNEFFFSVIFKLGKFKFLDVSKCQAGFILFRNIKRVLSRKLNAVEFTTGGLLVGARLDNKLKKAVPLPPRGDQLGPTRILLGQYNCHKCCYPSYQGRHSILFRLSVHPNHE